jgi:hypothetical protein
MFYASGAGSTTNHRLRIAMSPNRAQSQLCPGDPTLECNRKIVLAIAIMCVVAVLAGCRTSEHSPKPSSAPFERISSREHSYSTRFAETENPISEGGRWMGGDSGGASLKEGGHLRTMGRLWGDVQTSSGFAYGVDEPTEFGDPTAILTGQWGPAQTVTATVKIYKTPRGTCCHEVELRLRTTISPLKITGYEAYCSVMPDNPYCHIARWNGPNGSYWNLEKQSKNTFVADGDVMKATITGTNPVVITLYKNGELVAQAVDTGSAGGGFAAFGPWTSGNPGIGFYDEHDKDWKDFGFSSFRATDLGPDTPPTAHRDK